MPKCSFVTPTHNRIEWLPICLQSLLSQTEQDIEIIIVNDASTDGTKEFLDEWAVKDPRVKVIHNETSQKAGGSRNIGAAAATSDIIIPFDDDDVAINTKAEDVLKWFASHPESELVNFPYVSIDYFENVLEVFHGQPFDHEGFKKDGGVSYFCNPASAHKKKSADEIGGYPTEKEGITDDYQFLQNWIAAGKKVDFCGDNGKGELPLATMHRILPDSMMAKLRGFDPRWIRKPVTA